MIKTLTAFTEEIDDIDSAVQDIQQQLAQEKLLANSVGIISCFSDFLNDGVVEALADVLPFPLVGTTTLANAAGQTMSTTMLTCTVLTSDDVQFATGLSDPIAGSNPEALRGGYEKAAACLPGKPAMMIAFVPLLTNVGGDFFVDSLGEISGGVPLFGTLAVDHHSDYRESRVIYGGNGYADRLAFVLLYGAVEPSFFVASISEKTLFRDKGVVTGASGNQLQTVNDMPVSEYLLSLGLTRNEQGEIEGINSFPFIVDYNDGTQPVVRVMFALTPEGYAVCGGDIPVGATIAVGTIDGKEVLATTQELLDKVTSAQKTGGVLLFSCVGRYFAQGYDTTAELLKVTGHAWNGLPYSLCYSGGELCPVHGKSGHLANRNHNDTLVACVF